MSSDDRGRGVSRIGGNPRTWRRTGKTLPLVLQGERGLPTPDFRLRAFRSMEEHISDILCHLVWGQFVVIALGN